MNKKFKSLTLLLALTTATTQPMMQAIKNAVYGKAASESRGLGLKKFFTPGFKLFTPQFLPAAVKNHPYLVLGATLFGAGLAGCYLYKKFWAQAQTPNIPIKSINELSEAKRADAIKEIFGACAYDICEAKDLELALTWLKKFLPTNENGQCLYHAGANVTYTIPVADILKHNDPNGYTLMSLAIQQKNKPEILKYIQELYIQHLPMPIPTQQQQQQASSSSSQTQQQPQTEATEQTAEQEVVVNPKKQKQIRKIASDIYKVALVGNDLEATNKLIEDARTAGILDGVLNCDKSGGVPFLRRFLQQQNGSASDEIRKLYVPAIVTIKDLATEIKIGDLALLKLLIAAAEQNGNIVALLQYRVSNDAQTQYLKALAQTKSPYYIIRDIILALYEKYKDQLK